MSDTPDLPEALDLERLLTEAVAQALRDENPETFQLWLRDNLPEFAAAELPDAPREMLNAMAAQLGLAIWNALPLPGNNYQPRPLPLPGRNDPCLCGSGRKYKKCCSGAPQPPPLDTLALWPLVLKHLSRPRLAEAIAQGRVPVEALVEEAMTMLDKGRPQEVVELLQPLFAEIPKRARQAEDTALQALCDAYDLLGREAQKTALLERITADAPRSPLRAGAWQRIAAIRIDRDDAQGCRQALAQAMRDDPDEPTVALVELQLLAREECWEEARERSRFWLKKLRRPIYDPDAVVPLVAILERVLKDPENALTELSAPIEEFDDADELDEAGKRLLDWVDDVLERPLPDYRVVEETESAEEPNQLASKLRGMGIADEEIPPALEMLERQLEEVEADAENGAPSFGEADDGDFSHILLPPAHLRPLEERWSELGAPSKPFGTRSFPTEPWPGWEPGRAEAWLDFLEGHPEAGDSLEIIDDLVSAMLAAPDEAQETLIIEGISPLLERARHIVEQALAAVSEPRLFWNRIENRAGLRSLVRLYILQRHTFAEEEDAEQLLEQVLRLNPGDNHGLRCEKMNDYLRRGQDAQAIELAQHFPDDILAETRYGLALALYRQNRLQSAQTAAEQAVGDLPLVARYLVRARIKQPALSEDGIHHGGDDQAWVYRDAMRGVWQDTPGALPWLKKTMKLKGVGVYS